MRLTLASMFRDSAATVGRYMGQVAALRERVDVRLAVVEGDSTDDTLERLKAAAEPDDLLVTHDHGGPKFRSVDDPQRWGQIAETMRALLAAIVDPGDTFVWVESDLLWQPEAILELASDPVSGDTVAPMVLHPTSDRFYDIWGYRKDGQPFGAHPPYHPGMGGDDLVKIDSCGSCFVTSRDGFEIVRRWNGWWPFSAEGHLWLDREVVIRHP